MFKKIMGCHQHTASVPMSTQHQYQLLYGISTKSGCLKKSWAATSTPHQYQ
jgi:hypothetical protein